MNTTKNFTLLTNEELCNFNGGGMSEIAEKWWDRIVRNFIRIAYDPHHKAAHDLTHKLQKQRLPNHGQPF